MRRRALDLVVLTIACWLAVVPAAQAYIDAGSTSVIFQAVVAGLAASWMFVKLFWQRLRRRLSGRSTSDEPDLAHDAVESDATAADPGTSTR